MQKIERLKLFIKMHHHDFGMLVMRFVLSYALISHSANELVNVIPYNLTSSSNILIFILGIIELIASIMIMTGFLVSTACYVTIVMILYSAISSNNSIYDVIFTSYNGYSFLMLGVCLGIALVGPGKIVLNRRYSHKAQSLREPGIDKKMKIMGT